MGFATIAAGSVIAGAGLQAYGAYQQGRSQRKVAEYNAQVLQNQATAERQAAAYEAEKLREQAKSFQARQRTLYAKAGVDLAGSPLLVLADTADKIQRDLQMTYWGGARRAAYYTGQSSLERLRGRSEYRAGGIRAGTSLLSGISSGLSTYHSMT